MTLTKMAVYFTAGLAQKLLATTGSLPLTATSETLATRRMSGKQKWTSGIWIGAETTVQVANFRNCLDGQRGKGGPGT